MRTLYQVNFESSLSAATSVRNYEYLDILDRGLVVGALERTAGGIVCDVGCASFWYATALSAFFRPRELVGIDVEAHRLFRDGHTRIDHATGYAQSLPHTRFISADYLSVTLPADVITAWFPFVTPAAILAWRLPLSLLTPERLFAQIARNLAPAGCFVMINHGMAENELATACCRAAGLNLDGWVVGPGILSGYRSEPPILTTWRH